MARLPRIHLEGVAYAVTCQGDVQEPIFRDQADFATYLGFVGDYRARYRFKLFAYCLLPDQVHLCLEPVSGTTVSAIMHALSTRYTKYFNKRYGHTGHLFRERFRAVLVEKQHSLVPVTAYLHSRPAHAGLAGDLRAYPFSSYPLYCSAGPSPTHLSMDSEIREVLAMLPGGSTAEDYERYVGSLAEAEVEQIQKVLQQPILGSEEFVHMVKAKLTRPVAAHAASARAIAGMPGHKPNVSLIASSVAVALVACGVIFLSLTQRVHLLEQAVLSLSQENEAAFRARSSLAIHSSLADELASLEGTEWGIQLAPFIPTNGKGAEAIRQGQLAFTRTRLSSTTGFNGQEGLSSPYKVMSKANGNLVWETIQTTPQGEMITWQGELRGTTMQGVVTRQPIGKTPEQFTFVGIARRPAARSEI
ncbi:MAG: transposase [Candidatus Omnitrophica bacterium]|nr:transposase [Candidatus Omnitrophota bacterium]